MKNPLKTHRVMMNLTAAGGILTMAVLLRPLGTASSVWVTGLGILLALCAVFLLAAVSNLGSAMGLPQALGGLMILTGLLLFSL